MQVFRAYVLNAQGNFIWADWIEADGEAEAIAKARELCRDDTPTVELWKGPRRVAELACGEAG
jgi:hypothetical protein